MIVCSCNVLSDHDVRGVAATRDGGLTVAQIYGGLACRPQCGTCARAIRTIIR
jgi:bacterioferritin-associated ferredoxin